MKLSSHFYDKLATTKYREDERESYQQRAVRSLLFHSTDILDNNPPSNTILLKGTTGSGKTIVAGVFIDSLFKNTDNIVAIWLCARPKLAAQSQRSVSSLGLRTTYIDEVVSEPFIPNHSVVFGNWEKISSSKGDRKLTQDSESRWSFENLVNETRNKGLKIVLIIDEAHKNNDTKLTNEIVDYIQPDFILETTATPKNKNYAHIVNMNIEDIVKSGVITKGLKINPVKMTSPDIRKYVLEESLNTLNQLEDKIKDSMSLGYGPYQPLLLIQIPNSNQEVLDEIEAFYEEKGLSRELGNLAVYTAKDYTDELDNISNDSNVKVLIFKQAIAEGWDCPRASVLSFIRDPKTESLTIQTVGRIMRMVHRKHYPMELDFLNYGYIFAEDDTNNILSHIHSELLDKVYIANTLKSGVLENSALKNFPKSSWKHKGEVKLLKIISLLRSIQWEEELNPNPKITWNMTQGEIDSVELENENRITLHSQTISEDFLTERNLYFIQQIHLKRLSLDKTIVKEIELLLAFAGYEEDQVLRILTSEENLSIIKSNVEKLKQQYLETFNNEEEMKEWSPISEYAISQDSVSNFLFDKHAYEKVSIQSENQLELAFSQYIDINANVQLWIKNNDSGQEFFSIAYRDNHLFREFFPDFLIETDERIYILDTKGVGLLDKQETHLKQNALIEFARKIQPNVSKEIVAGVISDLKTNQFHIYTGEDLISEYNKKTDNWSLFHL